MRKTLAIFVALTVSVGLVACGGSGDDNGGGSNDKPALSKQDYVNKLNKAQTDFVADASGLNLANPDSAKSFKRSLDTLVGNIDSLVAKMQDLHPPEEVSAEHQKLISSLEDYKHVLEDQKGALASGDKEKIREAALKIADGSNDFGTSFGGTITDINQKLNG
jgi:hypothetical protein